MCTTKHLSVSPKPHGSTHPQSGLGYRQLWVQDRQQHRSEESVLRISFLHTAIFKAHLQPSYNDNIFFSAMEPLNELSLKKTPTNMKKITTQAERETKGAGAGSVRH